MLCLWLCPLLHPTCWCRLRPLLRPRRQLQPRLLQQLRSNRFQPAEAPPATPPVLPVSPAPPDLPVSPALVPPVLPVLPVCTVAQVMLEGPGRPVPFAAPSEAPAMLLPILAAHAHDAYQPAAAAHDASQPAETAHNGHQPAAAAPKVAAPPPPAATPEVAAPPPPATMPEKATPPASPEALAAPPVLPIPAVDTTAPGAEVPTPSPPADTPEAPRPPPLPKVPVAPPPVSALPVSAPPKAPGPPPPAPRALPAAGPEAPTPPTLEIPVPKEVPDCVAITPPPLAHLRAHLRGLVNCPRSRLLHFVLQACQRRLLCPPLRPLWLQLLGHPWPLWLPPFTRWGFLGPPLFLHPSPFCLLFLSLLFLLLVPLCLLHSLLVPLSLPSLLLFPLCLPCSPLVLLFLSSLFPLCLLFWFVCLRFPFFVRSCLTSCPCACSVCRFCSRSLVDVFALVFQVLCSRFRLLRHLS
ncbi:uncharacterized protein [Paramormyrops kingsleyae]|uniref:uncharacterized protein n=1 Tax=Paramormyrops kingsleyae TaxID=1676925 RepID=UPI003B9708DA